MKLYKTLYDAKFIKLSRKKGGPTKTKKKLLLQLQILFEKQDILFLTLYKGIHVDLSKIKISEYLEDEAHSHIFRFLLVKSLFTFEDYFD